MRPAVDALTHSDFLGSRSVTPSQARNTAHFVLTILELWGRLQSAAGFSPPSGERRETCSRRTEVRGPLWGGLKP